MTRALMVNPIICIHQFGDAANRNTHTYSTVPLLEVEKKYFRTIRSLNDVSIIFNLRFA